MIVARLVRSEDITAVIAAAITGAPVTITCANDVKSAVVVGDLDVSLDSNEEN